MQAYELILILDPALGEEKIKETISKIENKAKSLRGEVEKVEHWGSKRLVSTFRKAKKLTQGYYALVRFKGETTLPQQLSNYLRVMENVIRYSIARAIEKPLEEIEGVPLEVSAADLSSESRQSREKEEGTIESGKPE